MLKDQETEHRYSNTRELISRVILVQNIFFSKRQKYFFEVCHFISHDFVCAILAQVEVITFISRVISSSKAASRSSGLHYFKGLHKT